jgi:hypothetical protein
MATLILMFNKQVIKEYPLLKDSVSIGRQHDNTVVIDNLAVSGYHARIDMAGSAYILTDLQSTNGTFVNDEKIVSQKLAHGDNIPSENTSFFSWRPSRSKKQGKKQASTRPWCSTP